MAREFQLLSLLWLVAACIAATTRTVQVTTTTAPTTTTVPLTTTTAPTTTTVPLTTTTAATTTTVPGTTTTAATTTTVPGTTTTAATTTTVLSTTSTAATTTTVPGTTSTAATTTTVPGTTSTAATTTTVPGTTATAATTTEAVSTTTATAATTTTTVPGTTSTAATTTTVLTTTKLPDPCVVNPCGDGSTCEPRANQTFTCLCLAGDFYNEDSKRCETSKVFPGQLDLPTLQYNEKMSDKASSEFQKASQTIIVQLSGIFNNQSGYSGSTVLELRPLQRSKALSRSENGIDASVEIAFTSNTDVKTETVKNMITTHASTCEDCPLKGATFKEGNLCNKNACDGETTNCDSKDGSFKCSCKEDYIKTDFSGRICVACPSGQKAEGSTCVNCSFGYSGLNCSESWQLVLVIVGSVLGGLLLITLILLPVVASMCSKKNKNADVGKSYVSNSLAKAPLVNRGFDNNQAISFNGSAYASAGVPRIPRATTTSSDSRTNLEMTPSNSRQNLVPAGRNSRLYEQRDDVNPYAQVRTQSSLYGQNRPQTNPYASSQGHANPYYMHDNGRQFD